MIKISTLMAVALVTLFSAGAAMASTAGGGDGPPPPPPPPPENTLVTPGGTVTLPDQAQIPYNSVPPTPSF